MKTIAFGLIGCLVVGLSQAAYAGAPVLPGVGDAVRASIDAHEVSGAVTVVVKKDQVVHLQATGMADIASKKPMQTDSLFWLASMTKPVTGVAVLMCQDDGKLNVNDPVSKYLPQFADLKTPSGQPANLTITHLLTHTSGLSDVSDSESMAAHTLADLVPPTLAKPLQFEPGARWRYSQSGINTAARIVEVVSGMTFDAFVQKRILTPLGMKDTTFLLTPEQLARVATPYAKNRTSGELEATSPRRDVGVAGRPPYGNMGLFSTGPDYARFCQMLLNGGMFEGQRLLSPAAMKLLTTVQTGDLPSGFLQGPRDGSRGPNYGWGMAVGIIRTPHEGVGAVFSPGAFGHGGAWGTQAWIDPTRGVAYILMVQRTNFPNGDNSELRRAFQQAAADALQK